MAVAGAAATKVGRPRDGSVKREGGGGPHRNTAVKNGQFVYIYLTFPYGTKQNNNVLNKFRVPLLTSTSNSNRV